MFLKNKHFNRLDNMMPLKIELLAGQLVCSWISQLTDVEVWRKQTLTVSLSTHLSPNKPNKRWIHGENQQQNEENH